MLLNAALGLCEAVEEESFGCCCCERGGGGGGGRGRGRGRVRVAADVAVGSVVVAVSVTFLLGLGAATTFVFSLSLSRSCRSMLRYFNVVVDEIGCAARYFRSDVWSNLLLHLLLYMCAYSSAAALGALGASAALDTLDALYGMYMISQSVRNVATAFQCTNTSP